MATDAENLVTIRSNILARLAEITAAPKPSYSEDGRSFSWNEYQSMLFSQLASVDSAIAAGLPYEIVAQGIT